MSHEHIAIRIRHLSKRYRIGGAPKGYRTLRDALRSVAAGLVRLPLRRSHRAWDMFNNTFWALKDLSIEIPRGAVVGIIGRNGAGKSTLLKILSRITDPTEGQVDLYGRVGALLEVGTGFHPELTGRENIYLNGAILGMKRAEIARKFDEIVGFAEIEKFIDTPVKHYSSGMGLRLGFAVAAHLEPEILVVDEVLAVGDADFQKKCLGKMGEVAGEGRTVLFVSHNMGAIASLCNMGLLLADGKIAASGEIGAVIRAYQSRAEQIAGIPLFARTDRRGNGALRFTQLSVTNHERGVSLVSGRSASIHLGFRSGDGKALRNIQFSVEVIDQRGQTLFTCYTGFAGTRFDILPPQAEVVCHIPELPLAPGTYRVHLWAGVNQQTADHVHEAGSFTIISGDYYGSGQIPDASRHGAMLVRHQWQLRGGAESADTA